MRPILQPLRYRAARTEAAVATSTAEADQAAFKALRAEQTRAAAGGLGRELAATRRALAEARADASARAEEKSVAGILSISGCLTARRSHI